MLKFARAEVLYYLSPIKLKHMKRELEFYIEPSTKNGLNRCKLLVSGTHADISKAYCTLRKEYGIVAEDVKVFYDDILSDEIAVRIVLPIYDLDFELEAYANVAEWLEWEVKGDVQVEAILDTDCKHYG